MPAPKCPPPQLVGWDDGEWMGDGWGMDGRVGGPGFDRQVPGDSREGCVGSGKGRGRQAGDKSGGKKGKGALPRPLMGMAIYLLAEVPV